MRKFEGALPANVPIFSMDIVRIDGVTGAESVTHHDHDIGTDDVYAIKDDVIVRPERRSNGQFLVIGIGDSLTFKSSDTTVVVTGIVAAEAGPVVEARQCFGARNAAGYIETPISNVVSPNERLTGFDRGQGEEP